MDKALNVVKILVAVVAGALGSLAVVGGLPPSWHQGIIVGLSICTAISQFTQKIGGQAPAAPEAPKA